MAHNKASATAVKTLTGDRREGPGYRRAMTTRGAVYLLDVLEPPCKPQKSWTALHLASQEGKVDVVRLLTEAEAQVNIQAEDGSTALYIASCSGHRAVVKHLLQQDADVHIYTKNGSTSLMIASFMGHADIVRILIAAKTGTTPLYIASQKGHSSVVNSLLKNGADISLS